VTAEPFEVRLFKAIVTARGRVGALGSSATFEAIAEGYRTAFREFDLAIVDADTLERLRAERDREHELACQRAEELQTLRAEVERLRAECREMGEALDWIEWDSETHEDCQGQAEDALRAVGRHRMIEEDGERSRAEGEGGEDAER
jgi:hypothetical protein